MKNPFYENQQALPQLVEYECGCIGFPPSPDDEEATALLIYWCDTSSYDESPYSLGFRPMRRPDRKKDFKALSKDDASRVFGRLATLIQKGDQLDNLSILLKQIVGSS